MKTCPYRIMGARTSSSATLRESGGGIRAVRGNGVPLLLCALLLPVLAGAAEGRRSRERDADGVRPATPAAAASGAVAPADGFDAFRLIAEKNIFNPNRVGLTRAAPEARPPRVDTIALVGTVELDGRRAALFDSAEAAFRKTVREGETIADFTVAKITPAGVDLAREGRTQPVRVTEQLRRPEGGEWSVIAAPNSPRPESRPETAAPEIPADASDVLKRLMRQREKQLKE